MTDYTFLSETLCLFGQRDAAETTVLRLLQKLLHQTNVENYCALFRALIKDNADADLTTALEQLTFCDDNVYTQACARHTNIAAHINAAAERDILILKQLSTLPASFFMSRLFPVSSTETLGLPEYRIHESRLTPADVREYCEKNGVGVFSRAKGFVYTTIGGLTPVTALDPIRLSNLKGYETQRSEVVNNTVAFIKGLPAQNVLLYGDRGTGKSSTVKAILNEYGDAGLRMIELNKASIADLDQLISSIHHFPMRFIIFIDDLSFNEGDNNFGLLKAALEGSLVTRPYNIVIYATSNRRHLIKETFSAREGNEVHHADTLDESLSLSDRFGLTVTFSKPNRDEYLDIVRRLAADFGLTPSVDLDLGAEQWAILSGGRSPRVAKQYIYSVLSERGIKVHP